MKIIKDRKNFRNQAYRFTVTVHKKQTKTTSSQLLVHIKQQNIAHDSPHNEPIMLKIIEPRVQKNAAIAAY